MQFNSIPYRCSKYLTKHKDKFLFCWFFDCIVILCICCSSYCVQRAAVSWFCTYATVLTMFSTLSCFCTHSVVLTVCSGLLYCASLHMQLFLPGSVGCYIMLLYMCSSSCSVQRAVVSCFCTYSVVLTLYSGLLYRDSVHIQ